MSSTALPDAAGLAEAGSRLRAGRLVAFPTETVYGLGAHALDEAAVLRIFEAKGRPLTDPLIVHVAEPAGADALVALDAQARPVFDALAARFWPGPLTLVAPAAAAVPPTVCAGSGFVGTRCPAHPVARALLEAAGVPVAAPSANRFGHVSPTAPEHVLADLGASDVLVLESPDAPCAVGIESTVAKVDGPARELVIFRRGGVPTDELAALLPADWSVRAVTKAVADDTDEGQQAPGQSVTHYAPDVPAFLGVGGAGAELETVVVIDFGAQHGAAEAAALAYRDLSPAASAREAATGLFAALRWAEQVPGATAVHIADVREAAPDDAFTPAVYDRTFRACSGRALGGD